jgi:hypothetical protein
MKLRLQLVIESETGDVVTTQDVAQLQRHSFRPEEVGLTLAEAKQLLGSVQRVMVQEQLSEYIAEQTHCREMRTNARAEGPTQDRISHAVRRPAVVQSAFIPVLVSAHGESEF